MQFENPLGISGMFWTPQTYKELEDRCLLYSGGERVVALTTMAFTMNFCSKAVTDSMAEQLAESEEDTSLHTAMQKDMEQHF